MLGGNVRPGAWAGFRVHLENSGPAIRGELRITGGAQGSSTYGTPSNCQPAQGRINCSTPSRSGSAPS